MVVMAAATRGPRRGPRERILSDFSEVVAGTEEFDVVGGDAPPRRPWRTGHRGRSGDCPWRRIDAAAGVAFPDFDFDGGGDLAGDGEFAFIFAGGGGGSGGGAEIEAEDVAGAFGVGGDGDGFDLGVFEAMAAAVAPDAVGDLLVDLDDFGVGLAGVCGDGGLVELAVVGEFAAGEGHGLVEFFGVGG